MDNIKLKENNKVLDMVLISMFAVLISICSWITIPMAVPFTMQTFAIFCALGVLGGKRGTLSLVIYLLLGMVGLPVFSGFKSGVAVLFGPTGGYLIGFLFTALSFWIITKVFGSKKFVLAVAMAIGALLYYVFGTAWFVVVYSNTNGAVGILQALSMCVFPFIIPDAVKIALAITVTTVIRQRLKIKD